MKKVYYLILGTVLITNCLNAQNSSSSLHLNKSFSEIVVRGGSGAFPYDSAGFLGYTQIPPDSVNIQLGVQAFTELDELGENYAIGTVEGQKLYFDTNGWVISFLHRGDEPSRIIKVFDSNILTITNLSVAIYAVLDEMLFNSQSYPISYSDLEYPDADSLLAFWSTNNGFVHFMIPAGYNIINQSISAYYYVGGVSYTKTFLITIDGEEVIYLEWNPNVYYVNGFVNTFVDATIGEPHTIQLSTTYVNGKYAYVILFNH